MPISRKRSKIILEASQHYVLRLGENPMQTMNLRPKPWMIMETNSVIDASGISLQEALDNPALNWKVDLAEVRNNVTGEVIEGARATYRTDTGATLGIVGNRYNVIQQSDVLRFAYDILGDKAHLESAVFLGGGKEFVALARLNEDIYIGGEKVEPYFGLRNAHDGSISMQAFECPIRFFCTNQVSMLVKGSKRVIRINHSLRSEERMQTAIRTLGSIETYYDRFTNQANALLEKTFSQVEFQMLVANLIPLPDDASKTVANNVTEARQTLIECYNADDLNDIRNTAWGAFNAVCDYSDYHTKFRGTGNLSERQFSQRMYDTTMKDEALSLILAR